MKREIQEAMKLELNAYAYLEKKLLGLRNQIQRTIDKQAKQAVDRATKLMEYKTEEEVLEAYGWGYITETEKRKLIDRLWGAEATAELPTKESMAMMELNSIIAKVNGMVREFEYELLTDEEKEQRQKRNEEFQNKMSEIRARRGR